MGSHSDSFVRIRENDLIRRKNNGSLTTSRALDQALDALDLRVCTIVRVKHMKAFKSWPSTRTSNSRSDARSAPAVASLDTALIGIKVIDDPQPELETSPLLPRRNAPVHGALAAAGAVAAAQLEDVARSTGKHTSPPLSQPTSLEAVLRWLVSLVPIAIFACVSGVVGFVGALVVALAALVVLSAAGVTCFFQGLATMLLTSDEAMQQFATGTYVSSLHHQRKSRPSPHPSAATTLLSASMALLDLSCDLFVLGVLKGTVGYALSWSLCVAVTAPMLLWDANGSATALVSHSFNASPVAYTLVHAGVWGFAVLWLVVTTRVSQTFSVILSARS